jgi:succinylglutamate desuccinylase
MDQIRRVLIVGGTHGNEWTGVYLVKKLQRSPHLATRQSFTTHTLIANPQAHELGRRYVDSDLNRCFCQVDLENLALVTYEHQRAREIVQIYGTNGQTPVDFTIDVHSTTANMGQTVILRDTNSFSLQLAAYLSHSNPAIKILASAPSSKGKLYLDSISAFGCTVEVGAVAQGVLNAALFQQTEDLVNAILDFAEAYNCQPHNLPSPGTAVDLYQSWQTVDYPKNDQGELLAMVHPQLQFADYQPLHPGDPMFLTFAGDTLAYTGDCVVYPIFINEAAYYEKAIALRLTQTHTMVITP